MILIFFSILCECIVSGLITYRLINQAAYKTIFYKSFIFICMALLTSGIIILTYRI